MSDSPFSPPTSTDTALEFLPPLLPPPRPPRLRPPSRDSNASNTNTHPGTLTDVPLGPSFDYPADKTPPTATTKKDYARGSFMDMHQHPGEAVSPTRDLITPTPWVEDTLTPPTMDGDTIKRSGELAKSTYSVSDGGSPLPHPSTGRSAVRSVFLVLTCAGAMIINVSGVAFRGVVFARC